MLNGFEPAEWQASCLVCDAVLTFVYPERVQVCRCMTTNKRFGVNIYASFETRWFTISGDDSFTRIRLAHQVESFQDVGLPIRLFRGVDDEAIQAMWNTRRWERLKRMQGIK